MTERLEKIEAALDEDGRREFIEELLDEHENDWDGSESVEEISRHKLAVVIKRDSDAWVQGADTLEDVAQFEIEVLNAEYDVEWVEAVYDLTTREPISYRRQLTITVTTEDGQSATASVPS